MKNKDLNLLAKEVHENSVKHGFWDNNESAEHCLMMVVTELAEAAQADREWRLAYIDVLDDALVLAEIQIGEVKDRTYRKKFEIFIKDTVEDELADAYLRLLDLAGKEKVNLNAWICCTENVVSDNKTFTENVYAITKDLVNSKYSLEEKIRYAKFQVEAFADVLGIDLMRHVELKMKYNKLRENKHGKRY